METSRKIDPVLKAWIDNVLVPVMVRRYLESCGVEEDNDSIPNSLQDSIMPESERDQ